MKINTVTDIIKSDHFHSEPFSVPEPLWPVQWGLEEELYLFEQEVAKSYPNKAKVTLADGESLLMFGSYSYLGLLQHPVIDRAAMEAVRNFGSGTHGVRLLTGTISLHKQLEQRISRFVGHPEAIVFASGYMTNLSVITALVSRGDYILLDQLSHASIYDGCRLSGAKSIRFKHNDMGDLEQKLAKLPRAANKLVLTDGVFSMDGDIVDLPAIVDIAHQYGALLAVDEAHSIGVLGDTGRGVEEHFGLKAGSIDIKIGTLSKAIPSMGGYVAADGQLIELIKHQGRSFIYSASLAPPLAAAALAAFDVIEQEGWRIRQLHKNSHYLKQALDGMGFNTLSTSTAIFPICCGNNETAWRMAKYCQDRGILVQGIPSPVVPEGMARLRCIVTADHTIDDLDHFLAVLGEAGKRFKLI